jgi:excisionase family DNA binding protein
MSVTDAAAVLSCSRGHVINLIAKGHLRGGRHRHRTGEDPHLSGGPERVHREQDPLNAETN